MKLSSLIPVAKSSMKSHLYWRLYHHFIRGFIPSCSKFLFL